MTRKLLALSEVSFGELAVVLTYAGGYAAQSGAERIDGNGVSPWLLSIGLRGGRRHRPWLQYCPYCLHDDPDPYFRRRWRLTFVTVCPPHRCRLLDRCAACGAPCNIYQGSSDAKAI